MSSVENGLIISTSILIYPFKKYILHLCYVRCCTILYKLNTLEVLFIKLLNNIEKYSSQLI